MRSIYALPLILIGAGLAPAAQSADTRVGFVDVRRAVNEVEEGKAATAALKKDLEEKEKTLNAKQAEVQKLGEEFEKQQAVLSDQVKQQKAAELDKKAGEVRQLYMQLQQDLSSREEKALKGIFEKVNGLVKEIADAEGLQLVVERSSVVWAAASLDITNEVIRKYNSRFPAKAAGAKPADGTKPAEGGAKPAKKPGK